MHKLIGYLLLSLLISWHAAAQDTVTATDRFNALQTEVEVAKAELSAATESADLSAARLVLQESRVEL